VRFRKEINFLALLFVAVAPATLSPLPGLASPSKKLTDKPNEKALTPEEFRNLLEGAKSMDFLIQKATNPSQKTELQIKQAQIWLKAGRDTLLRPDKDAKAATERARPYFQKSEASASAALLGPFRETADPAERAQKLESGIRFKTPRRTAPGALLQPSERQRLGQIPRGVEPKSHSRK
jgi:hypothetical protein